MKLSTLIAIGVAAVGLAACGSVEQPVNSSTGVAYVQPGSKMEQTRSWAFNQRPTPKTCADGQSARYLYSLPGGPDCAADRPQ